jgi:hypothetical protein
VHYFYVSYNDWRENKLNTFSIEESTLRSVLDAIPEIVVSKYMLLGIDIANIQTLSRNALAYFVKFPPTEKQITLISNVSSGNKTLQKIVEAKN